MRPAGHADAGVGRYGAEGAKSLAVEEHHVPSPAPASPTSPPHTSAARTPQWANSVTVLILALMEAGVKPSR